MIAHSKGVQIFQGIISVILGFVSILLAIILRQSAFPTMTLTTFFIVGLVLIFSGDYLINPFSMPADPFKQQFLSEMCLIAYGTFYVNIGMSRLLQSLLVMNISQILDPVWIRRVISSIGILLIIGGIYGVVSLLKNPDIEPSE